MNLLATLLDVLTRVRVEDLTARFLDLYNAVAQTLNAEDQEVARAALEDLRKDNDEGHARLQAKLEAAKTR